MEPLPLAICELSEKIKQTRAARIRSASGASFDIAIIGGGVMGAAAAREAALRGYSTLLLEKVDYAWGTSSRSSKMLHGGIRYLEQGDVTLVAEALREREILSRTAPHLTRVENALFPVCPNRGRPAWQV